MLPTGTAPVLPVHKAGVLLLNEESFYTRCRICTDEAFAAELKSAPFDYLGNLVLTNY